MFTMKSLCQRCSGVISLTSLCVFLCFLQSAATAKCPSQILQGTSGSLTTPNYPNHYGSHSNCSWLITVPEEQTIKLIFLDFLLEKDYECYADAVRVYDGKNTSATMIGSYCAGMNPFIIYSTSNNIYIRFTSDRSLNYRGFRAMYKAHGQKAPTTRTTISQPTTEVIMVFTRKLKNVTTVHVGDEVKLYCHVIGAKNINIVWNKDQNPVALNLINQAQLVDGFKSTLKIRKVVEEDAGDYVCIANDDASHAIHSSGRLVVIEAPTTRTTTSQPTTEVIMVFTRKLKNVTTVHVGDEVKLYCHVIGAKNINIVWSKDQNPVALNLINQVQLVDGFKSTLKIRKVVKEDAGDYVCIANDDASHLIHSSGRLVVKELTVASPTVGARPTTGKTTAQSVTTQGIQSAVGAKPFIIHPPENTTAQHGEEVTLICEATGFPTPYVSWFMDGKLVANNTKDGASHFKLKVKESVTKVKCKAQNLHGNDFRDAFIAAHGPSAVVAATQPQEQGMSLSRETLVVVILCVMLAVVLLALGGIVFIRNRNHINHIKIPLPSNLEQLAQNPIFEQTSNDYANPQLEDWELPRNNIEFLNDLADGTFFRIFLGKLNHPTRGDQGALVMVKALKEANPSAALKDRFDEDAFKWGTVTHMNVQSLLGICAVDRPLCLVFEYEDLTNLGHFLRDCGRNHYTIHQKSNPDDEKLELSNLDQIGIATQIAAGMEYLSARGHIHKELSVKNCVIDVKTMAVKISNLGFSWLMPSTSYHMLSAAEQEQYPVRWLPPEAILQGAFGEETDIWSFGVVLWEIYSSGLKPYYGMSNEEVISIVREGDVLPCPKECPNEVYGIMGKCWHMVPSQRPLFSTIHQDISTLYSGVAV